MTPPKPILPRGNYINGRFESPSDASGEWTLKSPADLNDQVGRFTYAYADVDRAITSARGALKTWRLTSPESRADLLKRYQAAIKRREEDLIYTMAREVGKPLWECKTEVAAMVNKVDITLNDSMTLVSTLSLPGLMPETRGVCRYRPLGVMAVVGPFNFPGHLPNGHIVPALATGNVVVFKPSEKSPLVGQIIAECIDEAGFPSGVFSLVQGEREVGRRLVIHEGVDGVLFTGSYDVGVRIKQDTLLQHWKLLALEMGGKNPSIIWEDAPLDIAVHDTLVASFITAGQRCSATSRVFVHKSLVGPFTEKLHQAAKGFSIGHPFSNPFMGPLIDSGSVDRYLKFLGIAAREGNEILMRGKALELERPGHYVTPTICQISDASVEAAKKSVFQQTELFAPCVSITGVEDLDHAIELSNVTQYGLVASVYTAKEKTYLRCVDELQMGLVNWNKTTTGASSKLPFGGLKKSGNHFPTALPSTLYCTYPQASLEAEKPALPASPMPGLNWK